MSTTSDVTDVRGSETLVELHHDREAVTIRHLTSTTSEVYRYLADRLGQSALEDDVRHALDVGVAALRRVSVTSDVQFVEAKLDDLVNRFNADLDTLNVSLMGEIEKRLNPAQSGSYLDMVNRFVGDKKEEFRKLIAGSLDRLREDERDLKKAMEKFGDELAAKLDPDRTNSFFGGLVERLEEIFRDGGKLDGLIVKRLSPDQEGSPLAQFVDRVETGITDLRREIAEYRAIVDLRSEVTERTPLKGKELEDTVLDLLQALANNNTGEYVEDVRNIAGPDGSKLGDYVYVLADGQRIAIEVRNKSIGSLAGALADVSSAARNRNAQFGIYMTGTDDQLQDQIGSWNLYEGDKVITHQGLLAVAVKVGRAKLAMSGRSGTIDTAALAEELDAITRSLRRFSRVKSEATGLRGSADRIENIASVAAEEISARVSRIDGILAQAAAAQGGDHADAA